MTEVCGLCGSHVRRADARPSPSRPVWLCADARRCLLLWAILASPSVTAEPEATLIRVLGG